MEKELTVYSQKVYCDATKILDDSKLIGLLSRFGKTEITGSYAANLMWDADIDIHVFGKFSRQDVQQILDTLIGETSFLGYMFFDWVKYQNPNFPHGYYLGLKQSLDGYKKQWKIDIWFIDDDRKESRENMTRLKNLTEDQKNAILRLKEYRDKNDLNFPSMKIYDAVIKNKIRSVDQFKILQKTLEKKKAVII